MKHIVRRGGLEPVQEQTVHRVRSLTGEQSLHPGLKHSSIVKYIHQ